MYTFGVNGDAGATIGKVRRSTLAVRPFSPIRTQESTRNRLSPYPPQIGSIIPKAFAEDRSGDA
jgi:hypothetical protein